LLDLVDDLNGGIDAYVGADEGVFEVVEDFIVDGAFAGDGLGDSGEEAFLGLLEALVEAFLFFLSEEFIE
jgi:hypothetical protein